MQIADILKNRSGLDVELLLAHSLEVDREHLLAHPEDELSLDELKMLESYFKRLDDGEPVAYITNSKEFYAYDFYVDARVLIPRPETELIVDKGLEYLRARFAEEGRGRRRGEGGVRPLRREPD